MQEALSMKSITNQELMDHLKRLVLEERQLSTKILHYLNEIERRRLYAERGFPSLFEFCVKELGYSEASAYQKISAMRLIREIPEIERKVTTGELTYSNITQAQTFFRKEAKANKAYSLLEKKDLLKELENKTKREGHALLAQKSPEAVIKPDLERPINQSATEIRFTASIELMEKLKRLKDLESHSLESKDYNELFLHLADFMLKRKDPLLKKRGHKQIQKRVGQRLVEPEPLQPHPLSDMAQGDLAAEKARVKKRVGTKTFKTKNDRYIPSALKQEVYLRDRGKCTYQDPTTGRRCQSRSRLQYDHIQPLAMGGKTERSNLRLLCQSHNQLAAVKAMGREKMQSFLSSPRA